MRCEIPIKIHHDLILTFSILIGDNIYNNKHFIKESKPLELAANKTLFTIKKNHIYMMPLYNMRVCAWSWDNCYQQHGSGPELDLWRPDHKADTVVVAATPFCYHDNVGGKNIV